MWPLVVQKSSSATAVRTIRVRSSHARLERNVKCHAASTLQSQRSPAVHEAPVLQQTPGHPAELLQWAVVHGGMVHPALIVTDDAPCGCRGIVAAADITLSSCQPMWRHSNPPQGPNAALPLIAVPEALAMTSEDALQVLSQVLTAGPAHGSTVTKQSCCGPSADDTQAGPMGGPMAAPSSSSSDATVNSNAATAGGSFLQRTMSSFGQLLTGLQPGRQQGSPQQRLHHLQPPMLLALLLAQQRRVGAQSFWHSYISTLPTRPPCAWFDAVEHQLLTKQAPFNLQQQQTDGTNHAAPGGDAAGSCAVHSSLDPTAFTAAVEAVSAKCAAAADVFGPALGGITASEVAWAYGQVVSRAFATGATGTSGLAMLPVIDMLNHAAGAAVPVCWLGEQANEPQQHQELQQQLAESGPGGSVSNGGEGGGYWCVWHQQLTVWEAGDASGGDAVLCGSPGVSNSSGSSSSGHDVRSVGGDIRVSASVSAVVVGVGGVDDPLILHAGEELYISYMSSCDAVAAQLSFGFVPPELK